jgi:hypothetical protein
MDDSLSHALQLRLETEALLAEPVSA